MDPDTAIYEIEACAPGRQCYSSALTVYAIGEPPVPIFAEDDGERQTIYCTMLVTLIL